MAYNYNYTPNYFGQPVVPVVPQVQQSAPTPQQSNGLIWIQGESAAKSYLVAPGNTVLLMDSEAQKFYIKSADASGMPQPLRVFEYKEVSGGTAPQVDMGKYVTREELEKALAELKGEHHE